MSNGTSAQIQFNFQRPFTKIYRVGAGQFFTTIQSAINQAIADGFGNTGNDNPCVIEIYAGTYTENLTLASGIHLKGITSDQANATEVIIVGTATYNITALVIGQNQLICTNICFQQTVAKAVVFSGTAPGNLVMSQCFINKPTGSDTDYHIQVTNTGAGSGARFFDCRFGTTVTGAKVFDLQRGGNELYGARCTVVNSAPGNLASLADLTNAASLNVRCQNFVSAPIDNCFNINNASSVVQVEKTIIQNTKVGGIFANFTAAGNVRIRQSGIFLQDTTSKLGAGTGTINATANAWNGSGIGVFNTCDATITVNENTGTGFNRQTRSVYVGGGRGYLTVQAAITAAAAINTAVGGGRTRVYIQPGTYTENLTLADNVDLIADVQAASNNGFGLPVNIVGHHTWTPVAANALVQIRGIGFNVQTTQGASPLFALSGAATRPQLVLLECNIFYSFASATNICLVTGSSNPIVMITRTAVAMNSDAAGACLFDFSGSTSGQLFVDGNLDGFEGGINQSGFTTQAQYLGSTVKTGDGFGATFNHTHLGGFGDKVMEIGFANSSISIACCEMEYFMNALASFAIFTAAGNCNVNASYLLVSGATYIASGAAGTFQYGASSFPTLSDIQNTLTVVQNTDTLTPIA